MSAAHALWTVVSGHGTDSSKPHGGWQGRVLCPNKTPPSEPRHSDKATCLLQCNKAARYSIESRVACKLARHPVSPELWHIWRMSLDSVSRSACEKYMGVEEL